MPVSFVDDAPLSPPLVSLVGNVSCRLVSALSPAQGFLFSSNPVCLVSHAGLVSLVGVLVLLFV